MRFLTLTTALTAGLAVAMPAPKRPTATRIPSADEISQSASHEALQSAMTEIMNVPLPPVGPIGGVPAKRNDPTATRIPSADEISQSASHEALQSAMAELMNGPLPPFGPIGGEVPVKRSDISPPPKATEAQAYQDAINDGWKIAREFILRDSTNGSDFQEVVKEKSMGVMVLRWFEKAHGANGDGGEQLLDGYPAELDEAVLDLLKGVRRFDGKAWPRLTARDFDGYEEHTLNGSITTTEMLNKEEAGKVKRHYHSRQSMLSMLEGHPALQNSSHDEILILRDFLAEPALGFASRSFGYMCDTNDMFPANCSNASLFAAAKHWASLYPHEAKAEPREDWLTLFEKFQWWTATKTDKKTVAGDVVKTMPFREITEAWEKTFMPPKPCGGPLQPPCLGDYVPGAPLEKK